MKEEIQDMLNISREKKGIDDILASCIRERQKHTNLCIAPCKVTCGEKCPILQKEMRKSAFFWCAQTAFRKMRLIDKVCRLVLSPALKNGGYDVVIRHRIIESLWLFVV